MSRRSGRAAAKPDRFTRYSYFLWICQCFGEAKIFCKNEKNWQCPKIFASLHRSAEEQHLHV